MSRFRCKALIPISCDYNLSNSICSPKHILYLVSEQQCLCTSPDPLLRSLHSHKTTYILSLLSLRQHTRFSASHLWSRNRFPPSSVLNLHEKPMAWSGYWISSNIVLIELSYKSRYDEKAIRAVITPDRWGTCLARQAAATSHTAWKLKNKSRYIIFWFLLTFVQIRSIALVLV